MIELLAVVTVIAVLSGLAIAALPQVRFNAKALQGTQRINEVLRQINRLGEQEGSPTFVVQRDLAVGGVLTFTYPAGALVPEPAGGAFLDVSKPHHFGFPWSKTNDIGSADPDMFADGSKLSSAQLKDLDPQRSAAFLTKVGILPATDPVTAYLNDRSSSRLWNDPWGNPLVVAYGLFQPENKTLIPLALKAWQYNRSLYIAVGAAGTIRRRPFDAAAAAACLADDWDLINSVCQPTAAETWDAVAWERPPWSGVKRGRRTLDGRDHRCLLSTPIEMK